MRPGPPPGGYSVTTHGLPLVLIWRARDMRLFRVIHGPRGRLVRAPERVRGSLSALAAAGFRKLCGAFRLAAEPPEHQRAGAPGSPSGTGLAASHAEHAPAVPPDVPGAGRRQAPAVTEHGAVMAAGQFRQDDGRGDDQQEREHRVGQQAQAERQDHAVDHGLDREEHAHGDPGPQDRRADGQPGRPRGGRLLAHHRPAPALALVPACGCGERERARARRFLRMLRMMSSARNGTVIAMSATACLCGVSCAKAGWWISQAAAARAAPMRTRERVMMVPFSAGARR